MSQPSSSENPLRTHSPGSPTGRVPSPPKPDRNQPTTPGTRARMNPPKSKADIPGLVTPASAAPASSPQAPTSAKSVRMPGSKAVPPLPPIITSQDALRSMGHQREQASHEAQPVSHMGGRSAAPAYMPPIQVPPAFNRPQPWDADRPGGHPRSPVDSQHYYPAGGLNSAPAYTRISQAPWNTQPWPQPTKPRSGESQEKVAYPSNYAPVNHTTLDGRMPPMNRETKEPLTLRELLLAYKNDPDLLKLILPAKTEEDRWRTEELRNQTESLRLQQRRLDISYLELQRGGPSAESIPSHTIHPAGYGGKPGTVAEGVGPAGSGYHPDFEHPGPHRSGYPANNGALPHHQPKQLATETLGNGSRRDSATPWESGSFSASYDSHPVRGPMQPTVVSAHPYSTNEQHPGMMSHMQSPRSAIVLPVTGVKRPTTHEQVMEAMRKKIHSKIQTRGHPAGPSTAHPYSPSPAKSPK
ncbi:hypothetical protein IWQ61_006938 [Dispira simplex]|nr:hypothetical protein IWQ61_006938 [Dispira simplex]